jgi:lipopolysaccharide biosynthesis glycosyltransferase
MHRPSLESIHVAVISDDSYSPHVEVLIRSLADHHQPGDVDVTWCHAGLAGDTRSDISTWSASVGVRTTFLDCSDDLAAHGWSGRIGLLYLRLLLPQLLPQVPRLIFLDADTVVTDSLWPLWNSAMKSKACGGVRDHWVGSTRFFATHPLEPEARRVYDADTYLNAGVLLLDCERWRTRRLTAATLACLSPAWMLLDQDALNRGCADDIVVLDPRWNVHPGIVWRAYEDPDVSPAARRRLRRACATPGIVHYAGPIKPWLANWDGGLMGWYYYRTRQRTRWRVNGSWATRLRLGVMAMVITVRKLPGVYTALYRVRRSLRRPLGWRRWLRDG